MRGVSPCLTRTRAAAGFCLPARGRRMTLAERFSLLGIPLRVLQCKQSISDRQLGMMVGNALSLNVLERLLVRILRACGLRKPVKDRWVGRDECAGRIDMHRSVDRPECRPMLVQRARSLRCTPALTVSFRARCAHANSHIHAHPYPGSAPHTDLASA